MAEEEVEVEALDRLITPPGTLTTKSSSSFTVTAEVGPLSQLQKTCLSLDFDGEDDERPRHIGRLYFLPSDDGQGQNSRRHRIRVGLVSEVWFTGGRLEVEAGGMLPVCRDFAAAEAVRMTTSPPESDRQLLSMSICVLSGRNIGRSIRSVTLTLRDLEGLKLGEDGFFKGSGERFPARPKPSFIMKNMRSSFQDMDFSDFKLVCQGEEFKCHKFILGLASPVLKSFLSHASKEVEESAIVIKDSEPSAVKGLLKYIYTGKVAIESESVTNHLSQMLRLADKYDIPPLKRECGEMLIKCINTESASDILQLARMLRIEELEIAAKKFILSSAKEVIKTDSWKELLKTDPEVANDIIDSLAAKCEELSKKNTM